MEKLKRDICKFKAIDSFATKDFIAVLNPRFWPVLLFRISNFCYEHHLRVLARLFSLLNQIIFGCDIGRAATIDGGLYIPHPVGVVIGEYVHIGKDFIIHQGVTLGARGEEHHLANPTIGDFVEIGTGAKLLGDLSIGDYARVGANSVVLKDIPKGGVAVGIPAKIVTYRNDI